MDLGCIGRQSASESCSVASDSLRPHGLNSLGNSPGQNTGVGSLSLLQGIFPTQGLDPGIRPRSPAWQANSLPAEPQEAAGRTRYSSWQNGSCNCDPDMQVSQWRWRSGWMWVGESLRQNRKKLCPILRLRSLVSANLPLVSESVVWSLSLMN